MRAECIPAWCGIFVKEFTNKDLEIATKLVIYDRIK